VIFINPGMLPCV